MKAHNIYVNWFTKDIVISTSDPNTGKRAKKLQSQKYVWFGFFRRYNVGKTHHLKEKKSV